ncbi:hypothetical protein ACSYAF_16995 (plasmid) [Edwardsiella tarda]|uniref:hypothetical protein n=1 Tax=Edwardsiella tarda TaxID=636 RepID=UPI003F65CD5D
MAEAVAVTETGSERSSNIHSRPVFTQSLKLNSLQAQRVMDRSFSRVSNALFSIDVILRIIGDQAAIDEVELVILEHISKVSDDLDQTSAQLKKLMADNGIDEMPGYTNPKEYSIEINSPHVAQFAHMIRKMDALMGVVDTLWLHSILNSKQRTDANYQWQQRFIRLSGRIIGIEKRARISAHSKGKATEVEQAAPETQEMPEEDGLSCDVIQDNIATKISLGKPTSTAELQESVA